MNKDAELQCQRHIPKERAICTILLAGVSCPRTGFNGKPDEPFSVEAKELVRDTCLQRDVSCFSR